MSHDDTHTSRTYVYKTHEQLEATDLVPFRMAIEQGADLTLPFSGHGTKTVIVGRDKKDSSSRSSAKTSATPAMPKKATPLTPYPGALALLSSAAR